MRIVISEIPIEVQKKSIKNMHLQVKPPDGHVVISAPLDMPDKAIEIYARTNLSWIKSSIQKFQDQPRSAKRQYVSGETMYIWGKQYFIKFVPDEKKNGFDVHGNEVILSMKENSTVKQRESYVHEQYRLMLKGQIDRLLPKWEQITDLHPDSWQTKYMVTRWGSCNSDKKKLWFNLQLAQKPIECLEYIILHELIHLRERKHSAVFINYMDLYMPNWREIKKELNAQKLDYYDAQDESPLHKLIDQNRYDEIKDAVLSYLSDEFAKDNKYAKATVSDVEIQNVIHIEQPQEGYIAFDVLVSGDVEWSVKKSGKVDFTEQWLLVHCQVLLGIELTGFEIISVSKCEEQEDSDNDKFSGELVPIISRSDFDIEATRFLEKYYPLALQKPVAIPIRAIAEKQLHLTIAEDTRLSKELDIFGLVVFEDCNIQDREKNIVIRNAKRGTMYIDPRIYFERTYGTVNFTIAHECFHWHRHQPYHALMKMIGADNTVGKSIQCAIGTSSRDNEKWKAVDWMEWQANGVTSHILMPTNTAKIKVEQLIKKYQIDIENTQDGYRIEDLISELAEFYGLSKQAVKHRLLEMGYAFAEGACSFVNGRYVTPFLFNRESLGENQSFTISAIDMIKAYCLNRNFREAIDSGSLVYVDGHVCLNQEKYVLLSDEGISLSPYALSHIDECCLSFTKGYSYESAYQGKKMYTQMMYMAPAQPEGCEYSFEMNKHNRTLLAQIGNAKKSANAMRQYPGSFGETLAQMMKERKLSNKKLADASLVGEKTIQRLKNDEDYPTTEQTIMGLCYGLRLSVPEAEMLLSKTEFSLKPTNPQNNAYRCALAACAENTIYEINEMLESCGFEPLGSSKVG